MMQKRDLEQFCKKRVGQTTDLLLSACSQSVSDLKRENEGLKKDTEQVLHGLRRTLWLRQAPCRITCLNFLTNIF